QRLQVFLLSNDSTSSTHPTTSDPDKTFSAPTTPSSIASVLPLTSDNLRAFREQTGETVNMTTPKKSSNTSTSKLSKHIEDVRQVLRLNDMPVEADAALQAYPEVMQYAQDLLEDPRHSPPLTKERLGSIQKNRKKFSSRNETTFTRKFFGVFQSVERDVKEREGDLQVPVGWVSRDWEEDGLDENDDKLFRAGCVPKIKTFNEAQKKLLQGLPSISKPQPDILYGYDKDSFTSDEDLVNASFLDITSVSEGIFHPFFDVEVKTHGDIQEAVSTACTGGATLVQAHRKLNALVSTTEQQGETPEQQGETTEQQGETPEQQGRGPSFNTPYADMSTVAFSMVLSPGLATIYIHWAEVKGQKITYHMHGAGGYAIQWDKGLKECHSAVNNILDWGLGQRRRAINEQLRKLYEASGGNEGEQDEDGPPANKRHRIAEDQQ
ncbi:MAG: hypothetical protein Q9210_003445, partial [Variospora velana]